MPDSEFTGHQLLPPCTTTNTPAPPVAHTDNGNGPQVKHSSDDNDACHWNSLSSRSNSKNHSWSRDTSETHVSMDSSTSSTSKGCFPTSQNNSTTTATLHGQDLDGYRPASIFSVASIHLSQDVINDWSEILNAAGMLSSAAPFTEKDAGPGLYSAVKQQHELDSSAVDGLPPPITSEADELAASTTSVLPPPDSESQPASPFLPSLSSPLQLLDSHDHDNSSCDDLDSRLSPSITQHPTPTFLVSLPPSSPLSPPVELLQAVTIDSECPSSTAFDPPESPHRNHDATQAGSSRNSSNFCSGNHPSSSSHAIPSSLSLSSVQPLALAETQSTSLHALSSAGAKSQASLAKLKGSLFSKDLLPRLLINTAVSMGLMHPQQQQPGDVDGNATVGTTNSNMVDVLDTIYKYHSVTTPTSARSPTTGGCNNIFGLWKVLTGRQSLKQVADEVFTSSPVAEVSPIATTLEIRLPSPIFRPLTFLADGIIENCGNGGLAGGQASDPPVPATPPSFRKGDAAAASATDPGPASPKHSDSDAPQPGPLPVRASATSSPPPDTNDGFAQAQVQRRLSRPRHRASSGLNPPPTRSMVSFYSQNGLNVRPSSSRSVPISTIYDRNVAQFPLHWSISTAGFSSRPGTSKGRRHKRWISADLYQRPSNFDSTAEGASGAKNLAEVSGSVLRLSINRVPLRSNPSSMRGIKSGIALPTSPSLMERLSPVSSVRRPPYAAAPMNLAIRTDAGAISLSIASNVSGSDYEKKHSLLSLSPPSAVKKKNIEKAYECLFNRGDEDRNSSPINTTTSSLGEDIITKLQQYAMEISVLGMPSTTSPTSQISGITSGKYSESSTRAICGDAIDEEAEMEVDDRPEMSPPQACQYNEDDSDDKKSSDATWSNSESGSEHRCPEQTDETSTQHDAAPATVNPVDPRSTWDTSSEEDLELDSNPSVSGRVKTKSELFFGDGASSDEDYQESESSSVHRGRIMCLPVGEEGSADPRNEGDSWEKEGDTCSVDDYMRKWESNLLIFDQDSRATSLSCSELANSDKDCNNNDPDIGSGSEIGGEDKVTSGRSDEAESTSRRSSARLTEDIFDPLGKPLLIDISLTPLMPPDTVINSNAMLQPGTPTNENHSAMPGSDPPSSAMMGDGSRDSLALKPHHRFENNQSNDSLGSQISRPFRELVNKVEYKLASRHGAGKSKAPAAPHLPKRPHSRLGSLRSSIDSRAASARDLPALHITTPSHSVSNFHDPNTPIAKHDSKERDPNSLFAPDSAMAMTSDSIDNLSGLDQHDLMTKRPSTAIRLSEAKSWFRSKVPIHRNNGHEQSNSIGMVLGDANHNASQPQLQEAAFKVLKRPPMQSSSLISNSSDHGLYKISVDDTPISPLVSGGFKMRASVDHGEGLRGARKIINTIRYRAKRANSNSGALALERQSLDNGSKPSAMRVLRVRKGSEIDCIEDLPISAPPDAASASYLPSPSIGQLVSPGLRSKDGFGGPYTSPLPVEGEPARTLEQNSRVQAHRNLLPTFACPPAAASLGERRAANVSDLQDIKAHGVRFEGDVTGVGQQPASSRGSSGASTSQPLDVCSPPLYTGGSSSGGSGGLRRRNAVVGRQNRTRRSPTALDEQDAIRARQSIGRRGQVRTMHNNNNNNNNGGVPSLRPHTTYDTILDDDVTMDPGESNKFSQSYDVLCLAEVRGRSNSGTADAGTAATTLPQDTMAADTTADDVSDLPHGAPPAPCGNAAPADDDNSDDCSESPSDEEAGTHEPAPRQPPSSSSSMPLPTIPEDDGYRISIDTEVIDIWNYYAN